MPVDPEYLRQYYASLSDEALVAVNRADLVEMAQKYYDNEIGQRRLAKETSGQSDEEAGLEDDPAHGETRDRFSLLPAEEVLEHQTLAARPAGSRFMDVRKAALIACIAAVLGLLIPVWNSTHQVLAIESARPQLWWAIPMIVLLDLFAAILPLFYFALYRNEGALQFPKDLRLLALAAGLALSTITAVGLPGWIASFRSTSVMPSVREVWTIGDTSTLLGAFSNLAGILLLITFSRQGVNELHGPSLSRLLVTVTRVAVITWGFWVAFNVLRWFLTPYTYVQLRNYAQQIGRISPSFAYVVGDASRTLVTQACLLAAPYIVWRASSRPETEAIGNPGLPSGEHDR
jgi:hypothetical protein